ncbi:MAG: hypothetical protein WD794_11335 [Mycobacteriales bacterium]
MPLLIRPAAPTARSSAVRAVIGWGSPRRLALGRAGAGLVLTVRPRTLPQLLGVDSATSARLGWAVQMLGARELALGLGTLVALRSPDRRTARSWLAVGTFCDAADVLAIGGALARGRVARRAGGTVLAVAAAAVALGVQALQEPDSDS